MTEQRPSGAQEWRAHWPTVVAAALGMSCVSVYVYSLGAMLGPIQREFGWSRTQIGAGITIVTAVATVLSPIMGAVIDRVGPRRIALPGVLLYFACFAALSLTGPSIWNWWALWLLVGLAGAGIKPALWTAAVTQLFDRSRGLALAFALSGTSIASTLVPILATQLIGAYGWRLAYVGLAAIWTAVCFPVFVFCLRDARSKRAPGDNAPPPVLTGMPAREAILSRRFISLGLAMLLFTTLVMTFIIALIPLMTSRGASPSTAAWLAALVGMSSLVGRIGSGFLLDRFDPRWTTTVAMALPTAAALLMLGSDWSIAVAAIAAVTVGLSLGAELDAIAFMTGRYFGLRHYGLLFGTLISTTAIGTGSAPLIGGYIYDTTGSYDALLIGMIPLSLAAAALIASLGRPPKWDGETHE